VKSELVKPAHLARKAVVYIRQSTPHQVGSNQESLRLQYALRQRARELGWHEADIDVIDADLGLLHISTPLWRFLTALAPDELDALSRARR
jgi:DNA invertase Pin-like site-specific DNA recombinase